MATDVWATTRVKSAYHDGSNEMSRSPAIGFVAWNLSDAYIGGLLVGAHVAARRYGLQLLLFQGVPKELLDSRLAWERVDGWIAAIHVEGAAELAHAGVPVVTIAARVPGACPAVLADNHGGVCAMVRHLIEHGHRRIAFAGWMVWEDIQQRYAGYCAALADHGIPLDHDLVIPLEEHDEHNGRVAVQQLLSAGMPCTAIVAATDGNAIGAMAALHEAGYRVPEDVAVIGFNDEHLAQYTTPALTTVRQRYDALGSTAVDVLREHIAGRPVPEITYVPTVPILRESCGCGALLQVSVTAVPSLLDQQGWQEALAEQLLRLALYPQVHDPATPPAQVWPGITILIRTLDAAIHGAELPAAADQMRAWSDLVALTSNFEAHLAILALLERVGDARLVAAPDPAAARVRLTAFYDYARLSLLRALRAYDLAWIDHLEMQVHIHHDLIHHLVRPAFGRPAQPGVAAPVSSCGRVPGIVGRSGFRASGADDCCDLSPHRFSHDRDRASGSGSSFSTRRADPARRHCCRSRGADVAPDPHRQPRLGGYGAAWAIDDRKSYFRACRAQYPHVGPTDGGGPGARGAAE
jgi:DNA-binding LacI/PurR family transcriptional regulator